MKQIEMHIAKPGSTGWRTLLRGGGLMRLLPLVALAVFGSLFISHMSAMDGAAVLAAVSALAWWQWATALGFTALSFRAVGQYDVLVHRVLGTGQSAQAARKAGIKAIAVSQTIGFGALSGAIVRWRCLPDMPPAHILRLSVIVSLSFLAALAALTALVVAVSGLVPRSSTIVVLGCAAIAALILLARLAHRLGWIPNALGPKTLAALLLTTTIDTLCAALALWVLWPEGISFPVLFAAYLIALGAGLVSNAPAGVGAFDLTVLAVLGATHNEQAMAALLAFRVIYYAIPAGIAVLGLMHRRPALRAGTPHHPEAGLMRQSATCFAHAKGVMLTLPCVGAGAVLGDLPNGMTTADLRRHTDPKALYKCSAKQARQARRAGWAVLRCAQDAWIDPQTWAPNGPKLRQLRRALAQFDRSGLSIREVCDPSTLTPVATDWASEHGGERGHSMGRFCPQYLSHQRVFAAYADGTPVAFVSFHIGEVWTLDLMRHVKTVPSGTMHALVCAGLAAAQHAGVHRLSLASVADPAPTFPWADHIQKSQSGLRRFKSAFAPAWVPRYICASNWPRLIATMLSLALRIRFPARVPDPNFIQPNHEDYSFAPRPTTCEAQIALAGDAHHDQRPFRPARHA